MRALSFLSADRILFPALKMNIKKVNLPVP